MKQQKNNTLNGWLILNKPLTITSCQAVTCVKRALNIKKVGHAGTLDPLATGVLPLALGEATKLIPYALNTSKSYEFSLRWGTSTSTDDLEGDIMETSTFIPEKEAILDILPHFSGKISQTPPRYSALKVKGKRAYLLARQGKEFSLASRPVHIHNLQLTSHKKNEKESTFTVVCSKGTYIRSLARDIALACGSFGHVSKLHRTQVGPFFIKNAILLASLEKMVHKKEAIVVSPLSVLDDIPALIVGDHIASRLRHGQKISIKTEYNNGTSLPAELFEAPVFQCLTKSNSLIALAKIEDDVIRVTRGFNF